MGRWEVVLLPGGRYSQAQWIVPSLSLHFLAGPSLYKGRPAKSDVQQAGLSLDVTTTLSLERIHRSVSEQTFMGLVRPVAGSHCASVAAALSKLATLGNDLTVVRREQNYGGENTIEKSIEHCINS